MQRAIAFVSLVVATFACSPSVPPGDDPVPPIAGTPGSGGTSAGNGGAGGVVAGSGGVTGGGGAGGSSAGTGGSPPAIDAGSTSGAGGTPSPDAGAIDSGPTEFDPGSMGDGDFNLMPPYNGAPPELQEDPNVPKGTVTPDMMVPSKIFPGRNFVYRIYVPAQYDKSRPAALMVTQDGYQYVPRFRVAYDNLIAAKRVPVTIVVFVDPTDRKAQRSEQYDTVSAKYGDFVMQELLPPIKATYNITDDPAGRAVSGNSSGGIAAFSIAWFKPEAFHRVFTSSGTFVNIRGGNKYPMMVMEAERKPLRVYLTSSEGDNGGWLPANKAMAAALKSKGYHYRFIWGDKSIPHGGGPMFNGDLPTALEWLWRGYRQPQ